MNALTRTFELFMLSALAIAVQPLESRANSSEFSTEIRQTLRQKSAKLIGSCKKILEVSETPKPKFLPNELESFRFVTVICQKSKNHSGWPGSEKLKGLPAWHMVGPDSTVFSLPKDFGDLVKKVGLKVDDETKAIRLAKTFVWFHNRDELTVLSQVGDIPGIDSDPANRDKLSLEVKPPLAVGTDKGYTVSLSTWRLSGGEVSRWHLSVLRDGSVKKEGVEKLQKHVGKYEPLTWM